MPYENVGNEATTYTSLKNYRGWFLVFRGCYNVSAQELNLFVRLECDDLPEAIESAQQQALLAWEAIQRQFHAGELPRLVYLADPPSGLWEFDRSIRSH